MSSPIEQLVMASQEQHRRYYELYGQQPVTGDGLRQVAAHARAVGQQTHDTRGRVMALNFSSSVMGPFARTTGLDHVPLDNTAAAADAAGAAADTSAQTNVNGANDVAAHSQAEAAEIAAVPDPQSPAGQAAILAIIERYQGQSAGTVQTSATAEQAAGQQAASAGTDQGSAAAKSDTKPADDAKSSDTKGSFSDSAGSGLGGGLGGGGLSDILSSLLGGGGGLGASAAD